MKRKRSEIIASKNRLAASSSRLVRQGYDTVLIRIHPHGNDHPRATVPAKERC